MLKNENDNKTNSWLVVWMLSCCDCYGKRATVRLNGFAGHSESLETGCCVRDYRDASWRVGLNT